MALSLSGTKTISRDVAPHIPAAALTTLFATAVENLKVSDLAMITDTLDRVSSGGEPTKTLGSLLLGASFASTSTLSGTKTLTKDIAPHLPATKLTTIFAKPVELLTVADVTALNEAVKTVSGATASPNKTLTQLFA